MSEPGWINFIKAKENGKIICEEFVDVIFEGTEVS
jgi:hypothetical protein